jgi:hypothetical protein
MNVRDIAVGPAVSLEEATFEAICPYSDKGILIPVGKPKSEMAIVRLYWVRSLMMGVAVFSACS